MATNLDEQERQTERDRALGKLRARRVAKMAEVAQLEAAIGKLEDEDFKQRGGSLTPRRMSIRERVRLRQPAGTRSIPRFTESVVL
jgi:hypothetical protein